MKKHRKMNKKIAIYMMSAALVASLSFAGSGFYSQAASYIRYDNIIIRDGANGNIQGEIAKGTEVTIIESAVGTDGNEWNHVSYTINGMAYEGWVRADLMTADQSLIAPDEKVEESQEQETSQETDQPEQEVTDAEQEAVEPETAQPEQQTEAEPESETESYEEIIDAELLESELPDASVSGDGYGATGTDTFEVRGETMTISSGFSTGDIPDNFEKIDFTYNGQNIEVLQYAFGEVYLVYLADDEKNGEFYVLDAERDLVYSFIQLSEGGRQLIALLPPEEEVVAESYGKTLYSVDEHTGITAYQYNQDAATLSAGTIVAEYYYLYGITANGEAGWYLYDDGEKSFVRATTDLSIELSAQAEEVPVEMNEDNSLEKMIIVCIGCLCFIFFVLTILFGVRSFRARRGLLSNEPEEDEEVYMTRAQRRREDKKYRYFMENFDEEGDEYPPAFVLEKENTEANNAEVEKIVEKESVSDEGQTSVEEDVCEADISEQEDYDLTDENTEEDELEYENEYQKIERMLQESLMKNSVPVHAEEQNEEITQNKEIVLETEVNGKKDDWKDLEFLDF